MADEETHEGAAVDQEQLEPSEQPEPDALAAEPAQEAEAAQEAEEAGAQPAEQGAPVEPEAATEPDGAAEVGAEPPALDETAMPSSEEMESAPEPDAVGGLEGEEGDRAVAVAAGEVAADGAAEGGAHPDEDAHEPAGQNGSAPDAAADGVTVAEAALEEVGTDADHAQPSGDETEGGGKGEGKEDELVIGAEKNPTGAPNEQSADIEVTPARIDELKAKAASGEELSDAELSQMQVGYDLLANGQKSEDGAEANGAQLPIPEPIPNFPEVSGHVNALELPAVSSKPAIGNSEPNGKQEDEQPKGFARNKKEIAELSETTIGVRGLNSDVPVRSKIRKPTAPRPIEMATNAPVMPLLLSEEPEPNPNVMQLWMDKGRRAAAVALGFSEGGPLQSHKLAREDAKPTAEERHPAAVAPSKLTSAPAPLAALRSPSTNARKMPHGGFFPSVNVGDGGIHGSAATFPSSPRECGVLSVMAQESVASAQRHAAACGVGHAATSPTHSAVRGSFGRTSSGGSLSPLKGGAKLTWDSLEEMSFEDLLTLDARAAFSHLPPLPSMGDRGSSPLLIRGSEPAQEVPSQAPLARPSGVERQAQQMDKGGQRTGRAPPERAPSQRNAAPKKRDSVSGPPAKKDAPHYGSAQPPAPSPSMAAAAHPVKRMLPGKTEPSQHSAAKPRAPPASKSIAASAKETSSTRQPVTMPAPRSQSTNGVRHEGEDAKLAHGTPQPGGPPVKKKSSQSAPVQRPPPAVKKATQAQSFVEESPSPRGPPARRPAPREDRKKAPPHNKAIAPSEAMAMLAPQQNQVPVGFGGAAYMMPPMNYGMIGSPFGPPPIMNPYPMMAPPPAGLAAQFMPMQNQNGIYGGGAGLAQQTWMRGEEVQQKAARVGGRGRM